MKHFLRTTIRIASYPLRLFAAVILCGVFALGFVLMLPRAFWYWLYSDEHSFMEQLAIAFTDDCPHWRSKTVGEILWEPFEEFLVQKETPV